MDISLVRYTDDDIRRVAERAGRSEEQVRQYLSSDVQDRQLLNAFHFVTGTYPINKRFE